MDDDNEGFKAFARSTPVQPTELRIRSSTGIFQATKYESIEMPRIWSPHDHARSMKEGWAIGRRVYVLDRPPVVPGYRKTTWREDPPSIGKMGGTFLHDQAAHNWVVKQADQPNIPDASIYKRALAVLMALAIRDRASGV